jgi:cation transport ATPase
VKFGQNIEENSQSGIQAICNKITNVFVKGVITLSLLTVAIWTVLLIFDFVDIKSCNVCWVF